MNANEPSKPVVRSPGDFRRRAISSSPDQWVKTEPLLPGAAIPLVVRPAVDGLHLAEWAGRNRALVERLLRDHRALLFRGFGLKTVDEFHQVVRATSSGELLEYRDRSTPRESLAAGVYSSTVYPADQRINLHNEGTYWMCWPAKIYFCCLKTPQTGGETPIADVRGVLHRVSPEVRARFAEKRVMYVRNYNDGLGLPWQEVFQTADKAEVEAYCRQNTIQFEWKKGDRLRTRQVRPAIRSHPRTGEEVWFNHAAFFSIWALEPTVRDVFLRDLGPEELPYNTCYGDGSPIESSVVQEILDAYRQEKVVYPWEEGDLLLLDNMTVAHAREPYRGERQIVVAMTEPVTGQAC